MGNNANEGTKMKTYLEYINEKMSPDDFEYFGDCISTVDTREVWETMDMSDAIEQSEEIPLEKIAAFVKLVKDTPSRNEMSPTELKRFKELLAAQTSDISGGYHENLIWLYNDENDIHYFWTSSEIVDIENII